MENGNMNNNQGYGQYDPNGQMYGGQPQYDPNGQMYGGQPQYDPNAQMYGGQPQYNPNGQYDPNSQMYGYDPNAFGMGEQPGYEKPQNKSQKKLLIVVGILAAIAVIIAIVAVATNISKNKAREAEANKRGAKTEEAVLEELISCIEKEDADALYKLYDEKYVDYYKDTYDWTEEEFKEELEEDLEDETDYVEDYTGTIKSISYDKDDMDIDTEELDEDVDVENRDERGYTISEMSFMYVEIDVEGRDDDEEFTVYAGAYKRSGRWYLYTWYIY